MTSPRGSTTVRAPGDPRIAIARRQRIRWVAIGLLAAFTAGFYAMTREKVIPAGVAMPYIIDRPMTKIEAEGTLRSVNASAQVEMRDGRLTVKVAAATFPERRDGQLAFAQQYTRADELIQGRKRAIDFLDPSGSTFARADPMKGVMLTR